ncbi:hypothetical protein ACIRG5_38660 [Lentzea sp. NPDC102401]|uniref:hypothetical protein n=1 Tax=Lentzea sp. NPDC102401 TaxID=3364128 RepID=UPI0038174DAD
MHRRDTYRTAIPHQRPLVRVGALAQVLNLVVELLDALDHEGEVATLQFVEPDLSKDRHQVEPDVRLVAAVGVLRQPLALRQPVQEVWAELDPVTQSALGPNPSADGVRVGDRFLVLDRLRDEVADPRERLGVALFGDREQASNEVEFFLRRDLVVERDAAARPA